MSILNVCCFGMRLGLYTCTLHVTLTRVTIYQEAPIFGHMSPKRKKLWYSFLYQKIAHCTTGLQPEKEL